MITQAALPDPENSATLDAVGGAASAACAVHCALLPIAFAVIPSVSHSVLHNVWFESTFMLAALMFALLVIGTASRRHREPLALTLWMLGVAVFALALLWTGHDHRSWTHAIAAACGGGLIAAAHWINWRSTQRWRQLAHGAERDGSA